MKIVITTGGTGGHIYPAIALADSMIDSEVIFIGSKNRMESTEIPKNNYKFIGIDVVSTSGNIFNKCKAILFLIFAYFKCIKILKNIKPDIVIGFGNYISVPVILAAKTLKIKTMIHEQNSVAGKANLYLSKYVDAIVGSYDENIQQFKGKNIRILGNPRSSVAYSFKKDRQVIKNLGLDINKKLVTIVMGSLGSESVNKVLVNYCNLIKDLKIDYQVLIVTGKKNYDSFTFKGNDFIKIVPYIDGISVMANSDLLVIRSGATTCAEITSLGIASISIPSPYVPNNHQVINAKSLEKVGATKIIYEDKLNENLLNQNINDIINNDELRNTMANNALKLSKVNASNDIIDWIKELLI